MSRAKLLNAEVWKSVHQHKGNSHQSAGILTRGLGETPTVSPLILRSFMSLSRAWQISGSIWLGLLRWVLESCLWGRNPNSNLSWHEIRSVFCTSAGRQVLIGRLRTETWMNSRLDCSRNLCQWDFAARSMDDDCRIAGLQWDAEWLRLWTLASGRYASHLGLHLAVQVAW